MKRWLGIVLAGMVGLVILAAVVVYVQSERILQRTYVIPTEAVALSTAAASLAEGERLAITHGCLERLSRQTRGGRRDV